MKWFYVYFCADKSTKNSRLRILRWLEFKLVPNHWFGMLIRTTGSKVFALVNMNHWFAQAFPTGRWERGEKSPLEGGSINTGNLG